MIALKKKLISGLAVMLLITSVSVSGVMAAPAKLQTMNGTGELQIKQLAHYVSGADWDESGSEIVAFDSSSHKAYIVNGFHNTVDILDLNGLQAGQDLKTIHATTKLKLADLDPRLAKTSGPTSVSVHPEGGLIAFSVPNDPEHENGYVAFLDGEGKLQNVVEVGALPDMLTFTPDGSKVLTANEGQPSDDYTQDPEGTVSVIDLSGGVTNAKVTTIHFDDASIIDSDVRIGKPGTPAAQDFEPEYVSVSADSRLAFVTLQENNAVATLDLTTMKFTKVQSLGSKDHSLPGNELDASDKDGKINLQNWPVLGMYMPDGTDTFTANGKTYLVTANEGDTRDYGAFSEETRVNDEKDSIALKAENYKGFTQAQLDELVKNGLFEDEQLGRLLMTNTLGKGADGKYEAIYSLGGRSFSIFDTANMQLVFDSGSELERTIAQFTPEQFNASNTSSSFDNRSDDKGPEPEDVKIGVVNGKTYSFVGSERAGGVFVYDISNPTSPTLSTYFNTRDFTQEEGTDSGPEGLRFVSADKSPTGNALLLVAYEVSGSVSVYELTATSLANKLQIVHFNDIHSRVEESSTSIGYAKISTIIKELKAANPNTLVIDGGDTFHGQTIANLVEGESIVDIMNAIGVDAMVTGNHDYNYGSERLSELAGMTNFPILAANVYKEDGTRLLEAYTVETVGDVKVGLFGLATPETLFKTHPDNVKGLDFKDPVEEAKKIVAELQGKADVIIAIAHLGLDESSVDTSREVAQQVTGIDLIIDGHSHTTLNNGLYIGDTLIAQTGEYSNNVGVVELTLDNDNTVTDRNARLITRKYADIVQADPVVQKIIADVQAGQETILSEIVGQSKVVLNGERESVRKGETNLGNLIADAMLAETGADVALTNGGGIRASIPAGDITKGEVITVLPFGNYIQTKNVKGSDIKAALELGVGAYPESLGGFPHVAGIKFSFDASKPQGERVNSMIINGKAVDLNATYLLATNDFMAAGGDNYTMFKPYAIVNDFASLEEAVIQYLQAQGEVNPAIDGRVTVSTQPATVPETGTTPQAEPEAQPKPEVQPQADVYVVLNGDHLTKIAKKFGTTWAILSKLNKLTNPNLIFPGQQLLLP
jgi:5'-nucleotidase/UDP-sugar diphosphatase